MQFFIYFIRAYDSDYKTELTYLNTAVQPLVHSLWLNLEKEMRYITDVKERKVE